MAMQAIAAFWTRAKSVAHADSSASNPFLNPNAPAAATAAGASPVEAASSSDATTAAAAAPSAKARLPNPGKFENYNQEARLALSGPNAYDGAKFNVAKVFQSQHKMFSVSNNIHLGSTESQEPATFDLDIMYQDQVCAPIFQTPPLICESPLQSVIARASSSRHLAHHPHPPLVRNRFPATPRALAPS